LIRPVSQPSLAKIEFGWSESLQDCLVRRVELRKQKWNVRRRELELVAARNMKLPQLDLVAQYGWRGWGDQLLGAGDTLVPITNFDGTTSLVPFPKSAFSDLYHGNLQEWQVGFEFVTPIGNRIGHTAARNAELHVARERALLREMERAVSHELSEAFTELDRAHVVAKSTYNADDAANEELSLREKRVREGVEDAFRQLDALQRRTEA
jgi:outer membrane protein TolC